MNVLYVYDNILSSVRVLVSELKRV